MQAENLPFSIHSLRGGSSLAARNSKQNNSNMTSVLFSAADRKFDTGWIIKEIVNGIVNERTAVLCFQRVKGFACQADNN